MEFTKLIYEKKDGIAKITLNRPEALNALNVTLSQELSQALRDIENDEGVCVVILTGTGRAFCAGMDLKEYVQSDYLIKHITKDATHPVLCERLRALPMPTICAVNGYAVTGGLELVLNCDIIIASENAMFADTHARVRIIPGGGMTQLLPRRLGPSKAKELTLTGNYLSAQDAWHFGLVNHVVPPDDLQAMADKLARDIVSCDQPTVRTLKRLMDDGMKTTLEAGLVLAALTKAQHKREVNPEEEKRVRELRERGRTQAERGNDSSLNPMLSRNGEA